MFAVNFSILFSLPWELHNNIVFSWLDSMAICRLDSARCNRNHRINLLALLSTAHESICIPKIDQCALFDFFDWAGIRSLKICTLELSPDTYTWPFIMGEFFCNTATHVTTVKVSNMQRPWFGRIFNRCHNVKVLHFIDCDLQCNFNMMVRYFKQLKELCVTQCSGLHSKIFCGDPLCAELLSR